MSGTSSEWADGELVCNGSAKSRSRALILIGGFFLLVGSYALAKLPDTMRRLHGPTKAATLGIGALLIASMLYFSSRVDTCRSMSC